MGIKDKIFEKILSAKDSAASFGDIKDKVDLEVIEGFKDKVLDYKNLGSKFVSNNLPEMLQEQTFYRSIIDYLNSNFGHHLESETAHKIIDGVAHSKEVGGAIYHRLTDQRHSIVGAFSSLSEHAPEMSGLEKTKDTFLHLWADIHSVQGLPIFSITKDNLDQISSTLHLPKSFIADFMTFNSTEILSTTLSVIPTIYNFSEMQSQDFAKAAARLGMLTVGGSQFEALSSVISLSLLGKAFFDASHEGVSNIEILKDIGVEGGFTGLSLGATALLPFPFSLAAPILIVGFKQKVHEVGFEEAYTSYQDTLMDYKDSLIEKLGDIDLSDIDLKDLFSIVK